MSSSYILHTRSRYHHWSGPGPLSVKSFVNGQAEYAVGGRRFRVDDQCYLVLNAAQEYTIDVDRPTAVESFCLFFTPGLAEEVNYTITTPTIRLLDQPQVTWLTPLAFFERTYPHDQIVSPLLAQLRAEHPFHHGDTHWLREQMQLVMEKLLLVQQAVYQEVENLPALRAATREELYRRLHTARDYMVASLQQPLTLDEIARVACLSTNHFLRTFKQLFGQTPHQYLTAQRLQQAQHLLRSSDLSVTAICAAVGFESLGSFSWLFRQRLGCAPEQYRRTKR